MHSWICQALFQLCNLDGVIGMSWLSLLSCKRRGHTSGTEESQKQSTKVCRGQWEALMVGLPTGKPREYEGTVCPDLGLTSK